MHSCTRAFCIQQIMMMTLCSIGIVQEEMYCNVVCIYRHFLNNVSKSCMFQSFAAHIYWQFKVRKILG